MPLPRKLKKLKNTIKELPTKVPTPTPRGPKIPTVTLLDKRKSKLRTGR